MTDTALTILNPRELLGVYRDDRFASPSNYWRNLGGFNANTFRSTRPDITFEKIDSERKIAPFVQPTTTGKPTYKRRGSIAKTFTPAYIKPRDAVVPGEMFTRRPGNLFDDQPKTPQENWDAEVAAVLAFHRSIIDRRWELMAAQAMIYGKVQVDYEDGPSVVVDYARDDDLTEIKTTNFWDENHDIERDLQEYLDRMANAKFGGIGATLTVGREVWPVMQRNEGLMEHMDTTLRGENATIKRGLIPSITPDSPFQVVGTIGSLTVVLYNDFYEDANDNQVDFMNPRDIVLSAANPGGVMAFGAINDADAGLQALPVFSKMWKQEDPSGVNIMTQSAPLPIAVNPNRTFHARVVEEDSNSGG